MGQDAGRPHRPAQTEGFPGLAARHRGRTGLTQRDLAARVGVHLRSIQDWEAGLSHPSARRLQALIAAFLEAGAFVEGLELDEARALWSAAQAEAPLLKTPFDAAWFARLLADRPAATADEPPVTSALARGPRRQHWGEAPDVAAFLGRVAERGVLRRWVLDERCRVVVLLGLGGVGKTLLATRLAQDVAPAFEFVYWRSLRNAPDPSEWLDGAIGFLSPDEALPHSTAARLERLLELVQQAACLLVLDNFETTLQARQRSGAYRAGFETYGRLLRELGESAHQSCLLLTSREEPPEVAPLKADQGPVRVLRLAGLEVDTARRLLADKRLEGDEAAWQELVARHAGNGLALKVVGEGIREFFGGSIAAYLESVTESQAAMFGSIRQLLETQIQRLSDVEQGVLLWFAVEREPVTFTELVDDLGTRIGRGLTLEAVEGLRRRSMLERSERGATFTLQSVVLEYMTEQLVDEIARELTSLQPVRLSSQPLLKATAKDYVRRSQERLILAPLVERLVATSGSRQQAAQRLLAMLERLRERPLAEQGYAPGNLVNLLRLLQGDLRRANLSGLLIRQAYLREVEAQDASLAGADLAQSVLVESFTAPNCVALSADGAYLAVGTTAGEVCVWRVADRRLVLSVHGHTGLVLSVALSGDGGLVASGSFDGTVKLWEPTSGRLMATLDGHTGAVWGLALGADGRRVASGSLDGVIRLWETPGGSPRTLRHEHTGAVHGLALSRDGRLMASAGQDGTVKVWDASSGQPLATLRMHIGPVYSVALSTDSQLLASAGLDGTVRLCEAPGGHLLATLRGHTNVVYGVALSGDGRLVASGSLDGTVRLWEAPVGRLVATLHGHPGGIRGVALSRDGRLVAAAGPDGEVRLWEAGSGRQLAILQGYTGSVTSLALSGDGHLLASGGQDRTVRLWDVPSGRLLTTLSGHAGLVHGVALSGDGRLVASGGFDGTVRLWEAPTGQLLVTLRGHAGLVHGVALSADGGLVASGSLDGKVRLWEAAGGRLLAALPGHTGGVAGVALSGDGRLVASGGFDGTVRLWEAPTGQLLVTLRGHAGLVHGVALSADGGLVASGSQDHTARLWDSASGRLLATLQGHTGAVYGVALSRDGRLVITGSEDGTIKLWEAPRGRLVTTLRGHTGWVRGVALRGDAQLAASGGFDGTVKLWDMTRGVERDALRTDRRYERMDITGLTGVTEAQRAVLVALGAIDSGARE